MVKRVGTHEFERMENDIWKCRFCEMKACTTYFGGVAQMPCTYKQDHLSTEG